MLSKYGNSLFIALVGAALLVGGCGSVNGPASPTPAPEPTPSNPPPQPTPTLAQPTATAASRSPYPAFGHADDFSWLAGQVNVTLIQGGCIYVRYGGTDPGTDQVSVQGEGWSAADPALTKDGALVVIFGHFAGDTEPREMCPGRAYIVDRVQDNTGAPGSEAIPTGTPPTPTQPPGGTGVIVGTSIPGGPVESPPLRDLPTITPRPTTPLTPDANRVLTITLDDNGRTADLQLGDTLQLALKAESYSWTITLSNPTVLNQDSGVTTTSGQEKYVALHSGQTTLTALGELPCHKVNPPCEAPTLVFTLQVNVR